MSNPYLSTDEYDAHVEACSGDHDDDRIRDTIEALVAARKHEARITSSAQELLQRSAVLEKRIRSMEWVGAEAQAACPWCNAPRERGHTTRCLIFMPNGALK